jgi:hypothetical protein
LEKEKSRFCLNQKGGKVAGMSCFWYKKQNNLSQEKPVPQPIVCQDERLHQYLQSFSALFSRPQYGHFATVLMGLLSAKEGYTLSHLKEEVAGDGSLSSLSRFFAISPWDHQLVAKYNFSRFYREMQQKIEAERQIMQEKQPRSGRKHVAPLGDLRTELETILSCRNRKAEKCKVLASITRQPMESQ